MKPFHFKNAPKFQHLNTFVLSLVFLLSILNCNFSQAQSSEVETAGTVILGILPATAAVTTLVLKDFEGMEQFAGGFILNQAITFSLKNIVRKERPDGDGFDSFPSRHTSTSFQSASFIQRRYGWKYGIPAYALASFSGFSRINADKHDIVDVVVGAALGIGCTYMFTTPYEKQDYQVSLSGSTNNVMVGFSYTF
jgi:membrane-associated phospholipid phosphatase